MNRKKKPDRRSNTARSPRAVDQPLRIIGGTFRNSILRYSGDPRTRPMKERVREAVFNLVGPQAKGKHAIDLFAGTGALGLESLSRGAARATFIERHLPTARLIRENIASLSLEDRCQVFTGDTFLWPRQCAGTLADMTDLPWLILCSPPFDFFVERSDQMFELIAGLWRQAPVDSILVVESDRRFDFANLTALGDWDVRVYSPAQVGILRRPDTAEQP